MAKPVRKKLARITVDWSEERWALLREMTGETEPNKVVDELLRRFIENHDKIKDAANA